MVFSRRRFLLSAGLGISAVAGLATWRLWPEQGLLNPCLGDPQPPLSDHPLVRAALQGLDPAKVWDTHVHALGGDVGTGGEAWYRPLAAAQRWFFLNAACIDDDGQADRHYLARLRSLCDPLPAGNKLLLLALDAWHDEHGNAVPEHTHLFLGNDQCAAAARSAPDRFEWAASVHPYRADAVQALEQAVQLGARAVKWIPNAQNIDPAAARCDRFYDALARLRLPLISHAGDQRALPGDDGLGNPLKLRRALERGVRVIVAHCASMGSNPDLDRSPSGGAPTDNFALFERMMDQSAYVGRLFGDLSAMTQSARAGAPLRRVLERAREGGDWAERLLNGSDYPLPGIMPLFSPRQLAAAGLLDAALIEPLTVIRRHNPLLFDFVLKRHLKIDGKGFAAPVFETRRIFVGGA